MRKQNIRKAKWDTERARAYVLRDGVRYWAPQETVVGKGDAVAVFNPDTRAVTVRFAGLTETWLADATPPPSGRWRIIQHDATTLPEVPPFSNPLP